jgi:hypothetical protein
MSCNFQFMSFSLRIYFMNHVVHVVVTCLAKPFVQYFLSHETSFIMYLYVIWSFTHSVDCELKLKCCA